MRNGDEMNAPTWYPSASPFEIPHILHHMESTPQHPVFGHLLFPEGEHDSPLPCVVALHGSRGWSDHHHDHVTNWLDAGFAVFRCHCFDSRQVDEIVVDQMMVTHAMMLTDAFCALTLLCDDERIDSQRIAISGWSLGGTVALYAAWEPVAESLAPNGERFAAHMPFYPAAHMRPDIQRWSNAPILVLQGAIDDWTPAHFVTELAEIIRPHGASIDVEIYDDSHHSFDSEKPLEWLPDAIRLDHRTVQIDANGNLWAEKLPGEMIPLNEPMDRFAAFQFAQNIGCHHAGNPETRLLAFNCARQFLIDTIGH